MVLSLSLQHSQKNSRKIMYREKIIGTEIYRNTQHLDSVTRRQWETIQEEWEVAYHGTRLKYLQSILRCGLLPSGAQLPNGELIQPPFNHYQLGAAIAGVDDWASAIFVSPSIMYASHPCYSEYITSGEFGWCIVVKVHVNPSSYAKYNPTTAFNEKPIQGEPKNTEHRVRETSLKESIHRVLSRWFSSTNPEIDRNVVVTSVLFIDSTFRGNVREYGLSHEELRRLFY